MSWCTEYVPTVVEIRDGRSDDGLRHTVSLVGPAGVWTLCGQWIPIRRLRILRTDHAAGKMRVRDEERRVEWWEWTDVHRACAERHLVEKRRCPLRAMPQPDGSWESWRKPWSWLWHPPEPVAPVLSVDEAKQRLAALGADLKAPRLPWWRRWLGRAA